MDSTNAQFNISYAEYRNKLKQEALDLITDLEERKIKLQLSEDSSDQEESVSSFESNYITEIDFKLRSIEESLQEDYRDRFSDRPEDILKVIKKVLPSFDVKTFKAILKTRRQFYESVIAEYESDRLPQFAEYLKRTSEENFSTFFIFISDGIKTELEVANYYGYSEAAEKLIFDYVSKFYKQELPAYSVLYNAPATNTLPLLGKNADTDAETGEAHELVTYGRLNVVWSTDGGKMLTPAQASQAKMTLDICMQELSQKLPHHITVDQIGRFMKQTLTLQRYMEIRNLSDPKSAKQQLSKSLKDLYRLNGEWEETSYYDYETNKRLNTPETRHWNMRIFGSIGDNKNNPIRRGKAYLQWTPQLLTYISYGFPMQNPTALYHVNHKLNPYSYAIGCKIVQHKNMNIGKKNENRVGVESLLNATGLPTYEAVMQTSRHISRKIIEPFERDLFALKDTYEICEDIHYCNSKGEPLTDEQLSDYTYDEWVSWYVEFTLKDYPEQLERRNEIETIRKEKRKLKAKNKARQSSTNSKRG